MHISGFLLLGITFLILLCLFALMERTNLFQYHSRHYNLLNTKEPRGLWIRAAYITLFAVMAFAAVSTMKSYIYATDETVYRNVDYHVLSHKGYEVSEEFYLANGYTSNSDGYPEKSLWDSKDGKVILDRADSCFRITEFVEPFYVRKDVENSKWLFWDDDVTRVYKLVNQVIKSDISNGFTLTLDEDTLYKMRITLDEEGKFMYISTVYKKGETVTDTSTFKKTITQGYPLLDIIAKSPRIEVTEDLENWFGGALLVRTEIPMDGNVPASFDIDNPTPLCFMPGLSFYMNEELRINGESYDFEQEFTIPFKEYAYNDKVTFFSGIGNKKSDEFRLSYLPDNRMRLEFLKPDMKHIKDTLGRVFINSSIEDVAKESLSGGYLYNKFNEEMNHNHINAHFMYAVGDARSELSINIVDLNSSETEDSIKVYKCDKEFLLSTRDKTDDSISWIFEVTNLRETNDLTANKITLFVIIMFAMVAVRILSDSLLSRNTLSLTELAIYVIMLSLCVVRLILGWRASTFIPVEDISLPMYIKMRASILEWVTWLAAFMPLAVAIGVELWKLCDGKAARLKARTERFFASPWHTFFIFFAVLGICFVLRNISNLNRLCNISFPMIAYFIFEIWMCKLKENSVNGILLCRILAFLILFGYLFIADAGFTIIFLAYMMIHYLVLDGLYWNAGNHKLRGIRKYTGHIWSVISLLFLFFILYFEGDIMIGVFKYAGIVMGAVSGIALAVVVYFLYTNRVWVNIKGKRWCNTLLRALTVILLAAAFVVCLLDAFKVKESITPFLGKKAHMRYRAEIQRLSAEKDEKIDNLILNCKFESDDIEFIMRSAHNQWFINQYIRSGQKMEENGEYFHIQPHSNQGATYITQTTDLVVTRYLLAEHGERPVRYILFMWMMLILLFVLEFRMKERMNRMFLASPVLIYIISMMVYLSATNRIVFVGQDFPLISLQSRVAILFPLLLFALLLGRCIYVRSKDRDKDSGDTAEYVLNGTIFATILILFTFGCMNAIEQKGKEQEETQFDVSRLVSDLSVKVDEINLSFDTFQAKESALRNKNVKEVWNSFVEDISHNQVYYKALEKKDFFASLLEYFNNQTSKTDVNQLLHLRRRSGRCFLALNKQHYFIPAIMREENRWSGDIYASKVDSEMMLLENSKKAITIDNNLSFDNNVLSSRIIDKVPDMPLMHFGKEWVPGDSPLFLISSEQGHSFKAYFEIEADTLKIEGGRKNQLATAVLPGDVLSLYKKSSDSRRTQVLLNGKMTNDGTPYIVRNMWLNGHKQLFYPLGKESMWTYHLGNMVSDVYSKVPEYKDTTFYLSLDYELCKSLYASVTKEVKKRFSAPKSTAVMDVLAKFNELSLQQQCNSRNDFYYNEKENRIVVKNGKTNASHVKAAELVNKELKKNKSKEEPLSNILTRVMQTQFDFTAVAIDGDGQIRALFDYSRKRHLDPNNVAHMNKVISDLYRDGSNADERDIFGSKALQYIPSGPGSSFKPIAYTAVTSQRKLEWGTINVQATGQEAAYSKSAEKTESGTRPYGWYGGVPLKKGEELNIAGSALPESSYLVQSNNLHHSVIIMLGMQESGSATDILRRYTSDIKPSEAFPVFMYGNNYMCFNPKVWYENKARGKDNDMLTDGLYENYRVIAEAPQQSKSYTHLFGDNELMRDLYEKGGSSRGWVFPERASLNNVDRREKSLRGFNQILLGADPLLMTPLQMAINASRLASLNRSENLVSLIDGDVDKNYEFFKISEDWKQDDYLKFMTEHVWKQLRKVPQSGTASGLGGLAKNMESGKYGKPYYLYCKTGTLEDSRVGSKKTDRVKHLLVIITDRPLEKVANEDALNKVRYYALYLSYFGIEDSKNRRFNNDNFKPYIEDVLKSNSFKAYMNK